MSPLICFTPGLSPWSDDLNQIRRFLRDVTPLKSLSSNCPDGCGNRAAKDLDLKTYIIGDAESQLSYP
jgi:hypothetical protein